MMQVYYKAAHDKEFSILDQPRDGCWIHFDEANQDDLDQLCKLTSLDPIDLQDCLDKYEVPRIEKIEHTIFIFTRHPSDQELGLYTTTLTMIISQHYFITVSPQKSPLVRNYLAQQSKLSTNQKSKLLIYLLLKITQDFTLQIKRVRYNVLKQQKEMNNISSEDIISLTKNEDILNQYLSTLLPMRNVLEGMTSGRYLQLHERDQELLEDLLNTSRQSEVLCNVNLKSITSLRNSFQIIFTNNVTKTIKLLTALTIIFSTPTVVASIYGMNVPLPLATSPHAFVYVMVIITAFFVVAYIYFQRKQWL